GRRRPARHGAWPASGRGPGKGPGQRPRSCDPCASGCRPLRAEHSRRDAHTTQRLPPPEAPPRVALDEHWYTTYAERYRRRNQDGTFTEVKTQTNETGEETQFVWLRDRAGSALVVWHDVYNQDGTLRHFHEKYRRS